MTSGYTPFTVANMKTGLEQDIDSFLIAEDAFPELLNAYLWRGRVYKKGGNTLLGRLGTRTQILVSIRGAGNTVINMNLAGAPIDPGSIVITDGTTVFTDTGNTTSTAVNWVITGGTGTVQAVTNYATGNIQITFTTANPGVTISAAYRVAVSATSPVMGLRRFINPGSIDDGLVAFDMLKSYQYNSTLGVFQDVTFYKTSNLPFSWSGSNSEFFWSVNYQNALWASNGVTGSNFYLITGITKAAPAEVTTSVAHALQDGDLITIGNVAGMTAINTGNNGNIAPYTVTVTGANTFTIGVDTTGGAYGVYTGASGIVFVPERSIQGDGIKWYDGFGVGKGWVNFNPPTNGNPRPNIVIGALLMFVYKGYFVLLNTTEIDLASGAPAAQNFFNRARWGKQFNVFYEPPVPFASNATYNPNNWYDTFAGNGNFANAPTQQTIVAAEFIKDTLVVYFESSVYRLTYTGNELEPFVWEKINTELGAVSTFSIVPFDRQILTVGKNGIYATDSVNVDRIDRIIPDVVFNFQNVNEGPSRVQAARDYFSEQCYWTYINDDEELVGNKTVTFPNRMLVYNYVAKSFAIFKNSYTTFGHFNIQNAATWGSLPNPFSSYSTPWGSFFFQEGVPVVIAGNQQGFVFNLTEADGSEQDVNAPSLVIANITNANPSVFNVINHNLEIGDFVVINGTGNILLDGIVFKTQTIIDANNFTLVDQFDIPVVVASYPIKTGTLTIVDNFSITTKNLNPFFAQGRSMRLGYVDFFFEQATAALITVDLYQNDTQSIPLESHTIDLTDNYDLTNEKFWRRVYFQSQGQFLRMVLRYTDNPITDQTPVVGQMFDLDDTSVPIILHGLIMWMKPAGRLLTNA